jgi:hypothetical protein
MDIMRMSGILAVAAAIVMALVGPPVMAGQKAGAWLDMEGCEICAPMMAEKGLMQHVHWGEKSFASGMVSACSVDPGYEEAYGRAGAKMHQAIERYMSGADMKVCGQCASIKELAMAGAKIEEMEAASAHLMVVSATDPKLIDRIHAHCERTNAEMEKMAKAEK